ncbi:trypsin-like peptidase domain-containing protein [Kitasatospora sp. NPDC097643]|uniref:trypsin-like serine peptidase n=1 Tax=Kitasatospora sp. NPDC097643 TaxID=3157230 RepID=UPI00331A6722
MSATRRTRRTVRAALGASTVALTLLATSACGPDNSPGDSVATGATAAATGSATGPATGTTGLGLPANLDDLKKWKADDWEKWAKDYALPAVAKGYWTLERILSAQPVEPLKPPAPGPGGKPTGQPTTQAPQPTAPATAPATATAQPSVPGQPPADGGVDAPPKTVNAQADPHPYAKNLSVFGKIFFDKPGAQTLAPGKLGQNYVCSGTVVADPAHPGKSNLVWTAGHCAHQGKGSTFNSNIVFIPDFNASGAVSGGKRPTDVTQYAPYGKWDAVNYVTSPVWKAEGGEVGPAAQYDFAILRVKPEEDTGKSLEETVGGALPVWFNAPRDQLSITNYGYPAGPPFDGLELNHCDGGKPSRLAYDPNRPPMLTIGCSMTGGSSGGGWLAAKDGKPALVSNVSVGHDGDQKWQAGPYLDDVAAGLYNFIAKKG